MKSVFLVVTLIQDKTENNINCIVCQTYSIAIREARKAIERLKKLYGNEIVSNDTAIEISYYDTCHDITIKVYIEEQKIIEV